MRGNAISRKDGMEKAGIASVVNGKIQLPPEDPLRIISLSPCIAVSSSFWSTPVFVLCTFTEHLKLRFNY